MIAKFQLHRF